MPDQDSPTERTSSVLPTSRQFLRVATPAMLVMAPLVGLALHSDQSIAIYQFASDYGTNPLRIAAANLAEIGEFVLKGNFRPLGRFIFYLEEAARFDLAGALGVPPHVVQGAIRVATVGVLAWVATCVVRALARSATGRAGSPLPDGERRSLDRLVDVFPLVFASVLIVTGPLHPLSFFPFFLITLAVALLLVPLYIASDKAMKAGGPAPRPALPALVGLLAAMTFELMYLLPITCIAMTVLRAWLSGLTLRDVPSTAAFQRWIALCLGFLAVFIPSRVAIAVACATNNCYGNTNPVPSGFSVGQWLGRSLSGLPVEGWFSTSPGTIDPGALGQAWSGVSTNVWMVLAAAALAALAVRAGGGLLKDPGHEHSPGACLRLGTALVVFGTVLALLPAFLVSLSEGLQGWNDRGWGLHDWRDTLLVQVGWAFILFGTLVVVWSLAARRRPEGKKSSRRQTALLVAALALCLSAPPVLALGANARYAESRRDRPLTNIVNLISAASVDFDKTAAGEARRCALLADYGELVCESCWHSGPRLAEQLNNLALSRHGAAFCTTPR